MTRDSITSTEHIFTETEERPSARQSSTPAPLATPEELAGLDRYISAAEAKNGPVPDEIRQQFYDDLAAADAKIGYVR